MSCPDPVAGPYLSMKSPEGVGSNQDVRVFELDRTSR
jgi:hypothetical protein